jgi:hypothetical protein
MARKSLSKLLDGTPTLEDLKAAHTEHAAHRGSAIIGASLVEDVLKAAIRRRLVSLSSKDDALLFGLERPLGSFSGKITFGFAVGIYGQVTRTDLNLIREIRNAFAHARIPVSFETPAIREAALQLQLPLRVPIHHSILDLAHQTEPNDPMLRYGVTMQMLIYYLGREAAKQDVLPSTPSPLI